MRRSKSSAVLMLLFVGLIVAGSTACRQQKLQVPAPAKGAAGSPRAAPGAPTKPLTEAECRGYAEAIIQAVASGDELAFNALIDWDSILATTTANLGLSEVAASKMIQGMKTSVVQRGGLARALIQNVKAGSSLDYLRNRVSHGQEAILVRMIGPENQGVNYFEFAARRGTDQRIRAVDIYCFDTGEFFTETLRRVLLPVAAAESRTFLDKLLTKEQDFVRDLPKFKPITEAIQQGRSRDALRLLIELRPETKKQKFVLLLRIQATQGDDEYEKEYLETLTEFRTLFPNDSALDLLSIDYYSLKQDHAGLKKCMERLDAAVGGDPYLSYIQAAAAMERGDREEARRLAKRAVDQEPPFKTAYFYLIGLSLEDKNYVETLAGLKKFHGEFDTAIADLSTVPEYAGFVKSRQYQEWLKYLAETTKVQKTKPEDKPARVGEKRSAGAKNGAKSGD